MRTFALTGVVALTLSMLTPASVWAWSTEQGNANAAAGAAALAEQEDPLKALQDKVDAKSGSQPSGFYFSAGPSSSPLGSYGFNSTPNGTNVPYGYSPMPGFRGQPQ